MNLKGVKAFHLVKGKVKHMGDKITPQDCGSFDRTFTQNYDYIRLNEKMDVVAFVNDINNSMKHRGEVWVNDVIYITNEVNIIIGIIPINYKEVGKI
jgi:hypothetical protein